MSVFSHFLKAYSFEKIQCEFYRKIRKINDFYSDIKCGAREMLHLNLFSNISVITINVIGQNRNVSDSVLSSIQFSSLCTKRVLTFEKREVDVLKISFILSRARKQVKSKRKSLETLQLRLITIFYIANIFKNIQS